MTPYFATQLIYVSSTIMKTHSAYIPIRNSEIDLYNRSTLCCLWATKRVLMYTI